MSLRGGATFLCGLLVSLGLCLSGMANPHKVIGFLDVFGRWDPSLLFVMMGAVSVHAVFYRRIILRAAPLFASRFTIPARRDLDPALLLGATLFGIGWGLSGYCPGPVLASLFAGGPGPLVFSIGMLAGMGGYGLLYDRPQATSTPRQAGSSW